MNNDEHINIFGEEFYLDKEEYVFFQLENDKYQNGDFYGAINEFTKAINITPTNQNLYIYRGTTYLDLNDNLNAEKDFKKALEIMPNEFVAAYRLGMIFFGKQNFKEAIKWLKISYDNSVDGDLDHMGIDKTSFFFVHKKLIAANLGNFFVQINNLIEGFKYLDIAIEIDPSYPNPYMTKGTVYAQIGKPEEGIPYLRKAKELGDPNADMVLQMVYQLIEESN